MAASSTLAPPAGALLKSDAVAELLGVKRWRVQELTRSGELPAVRIGRTTRYRRETVEAWIAENER